MKISLNSWSYWNHSKYKFLILFSQFLNFLIFFILTTENFLFNWLFHWALHHFDVIFFKPKSNSSQHLVTVLYMNMLPWPHQSGATYINGLKLVPIAVLAAQWQVSSGVKTPLMKLPLQTLSFPFMAKSPLASLVDENESEADD